MAVKYPSSKYLNETISSNHLHKIKLPFFFNNFNLKMTLYVIIQN